MSTVRVDPENPDPETLQRAAAVLRDGGLVAFPTETVYGLGANALDPAAVERIFRAKGRPSYNPLIAHCPDAVAARELAAGWPDGAERLASAFWPGPMTLVLPKRALVPDIVTAGLPSVALRVPAHPVAHALLEAVRLPLAAPSANRFTELSPTTAAHVVKGLGGRVDLILDGGPTRVGIESTVVDLTGPEPVLLRAGSVSADQIARVLERELRLPGRIDGAVARPSPGMVDRHYAPRAELRVVAADDRAGAGELVRAARRAGRRVGALVRGEPAFEGVETIRLPDEPHGFARELYAALHELDDRGCDLIVVEEVPPGSGWAGVRDRLARAAHRG